MDMRNGRVYPSRQAAIDAGVPEGQVVELEPRVDGDLAEIVTVASGPQKGRVYERTATGLRRRHDLESAEHRRRQLQRALARADDPRAGLSQATLEALVRAKTTGD